MCVCVYVCVCVRVCVWVCVHFVSFLFDCFFWQIRRWTFSHYSLTRSLPKEEHMSSRYDFHSFFLLVTFFLIFLSLILIVIYSFCQLLTCKFYLFMRPQIQLLFQLIELFQHFPGEKQPYISSILMFYCIVN
jgi:hypothetical protein